MASAINDADNLRAERNALRAANPFLAFKGDWWIVNDEYLEYQENQDYRPGDFSRFVEELQQEGWYANRTQEEAIAYLSHCVECGDVAIVDGRYVAT